MIRNYITFQETLDLLKVGKGPFAYNTSTNIISQFNSTIDIINQLSTMFDMYSKISNTAYANVSANAPIIGTLMRDYVYPQYYNKAVGYYDDDNRYEEVINTIGSIMPWLEATTEKYAVLIGNLNDAKAHLLDNIKSISKFNDTPQGEGDYSDDGHNTTVTINETQGASLMARLKEIENNLTELYRQWSYEFGQTFVIWSA